MSATTGPHEHRRFFPPPPRPTDLTTNVGIVNSALYLGHAWGYELPGPPPMGIRLGDPVDSDAT